MISREFYMNKVDFDIGPQLGVEFNGPGAAHGIFCS